MLEEEPKTQTGSPGVTSESAYGGPSGLVVQRLSKYWSFIDRYLKDTSKESTVDSSEHVREVGLNGRGQEVFQYFDEELGGFSKQMPVTDTFKKVILPMKIQARNQQSIHQNMFVMGI